MCAVISIPMPRSPSLVLAAALAAAALAVTPARAQSNPGAQGQLGPPPGTAAAPAPNPPPGYAPSQPLRRRKGLMIGGIATLGGTYLLSVLVGVEVATGSSNGQGVACPSCQPVGQRLLIPIVGPWLGFPYTDSGGKALLTLLGLAQATGVVLSIVGISQFRTDAPPAGEPDPAQQRQWGSSGSVSFGVLPTQNGAFGFASARF
jgi:hypothetical protein